jgi:hypothetical protein
LYFEPKEGLGGSMPEVLPDPERMAVFAEAMESYGVGDPGAAWPNNMIARDAVVQASGVMSRSGQPVTHVVDDADLALCKKLAGVVEGMMEGVDVGTGSESTDSVHAFFIPGDTSQKAPAIISEKLIRARFGGTLFPGVTVRTEPVDTDAPWWTETRTELAAQSPEAVAGGAVADEKAIEKWLALVGWFKGQEAFVDMAYVEIGEYAALQHLGELPEGTEMPPGVLPRLLVGLTGRGGLAGGYWVTVQT